jgi:hypothetical protein
MLSVLADDALNNLGLKELSTVVSRGGLWLYFTLNPNQLTKINRIVFYIVANSSNNHHPWCKLIVDYFLEPN